MGSKTEPDTPTSAEPVPNAQCRGTCAFVDGHADYVPRTYAHSLKHTVPDVDQSPWNTMTDLFPNNR